MTTDLEASVSTGMAIFALAAAQEPPAFPHLTPAQIERNVRAAAWDEVAKAIGKTVLDYPVTVAAGSPALRAILADVNERLQNAFGLKAPTDDPVRKCAAELIGELMANIHASHIRHWSPLEEAVAN